MLYILYKGYLPKNGGDATGDLICMANVLAPVVQRITLYTR